MLFSRNRDSFDYNVSVISHSKNGNKPRKVLILYQREIYNAYDVCVCWCVCVCVRVCAAE